MKKSKLFSIILVLIAVIAGLFYFGQIKKNSLILGLALEGTNFSKTELNALQEEVGFQPGIIMFYLAWPDEDEQSGAIFPKDALQTIWSSKAVPCLSWEPQEILAQEIIQGRWDAYLSRFAEEVKQFEKPVIIRFAHEMNLEHYHWGVRKTNYNYKTPPLYKKMFQYVYTFFKNKKASNALFAFCPNTDSIPNVFWNRIANYYPGDNFVDIIGLDGYNFGTSMKAEKDGWNSSWRSFDEVFSISFQELKKIAPRKPLLIFETGSSNFGGDRRIWLKNALDTAQRWQIKGLIWFQVDKETDWRLSTKERKILKKQTFNQAAQKWAKELANEKRKTD